MSHHLIIKIKFECLKIATVLCGLAACATSPAVVGSGSAEQFSLHGQSNIFFDGGSAALTGEFNGIPYEIIHGYAVAQGDMVLGKILPNGKLAVATQTRGLGQNSVFDRWPDGIIPYQFSDSISQVQKDRAVQAIAHWNLNTRIQMTPRTEANSANYDNYVSFELGGGCASYVGMNGGEQSIWLADNCTVGSIIHEIGHAIGLFHEHTRPDRDNFVTINLQNVSTGKEINFDKIEAGASTYSEYDYGSIMHYGEYFFSSNGERSISAPDSINIGQREALSSGDIVSINTMYATDLKLAVSTEAKETATQIDLVVTNAGELGALALVVTLDWGDNTDWQSVSTGSGWNCQTSSAQLLCARTSLREFSDSSFSVIAAPESAGLDLLKIRVESRTLDTDLTNNVFNDQIDVPIVAEELGTVDPIDTDGDVGGINNGGTSEPPVDPSDETIDPTDETNVPTAQLPDTDTETDGGTIITSNENTTATPPQTGAAQGSSGGGAAFYLLALLLSARLKRKSTN